MLLWQTSTAPHQDGTSKKSVYILVHSPLVGGLTWTLVAEAMRQRGLEVLVPLLQDSSDSSEPFWKQHADSVSRSLAGLPTDQPVVWVAHSGAGPLLPVLRRSCPNPAHAYVFADAGIPRNGATRLDLIMAGDSSWAQEFQTFLDCGGRFPEWSLEDLQSILPDEGLRAQLVAELRPRGLDFFTEPIPVFDGWPDARCIYIQFSEPYAWDGVQARQAGWSTYTIEAGHFHMLVNAKEVAELIVHAVDELG